MPRAGTNGTKGNRKYHNLTVDADVHVALVAHQDRLAGAFGFKPSLSQVVRHLIFNTADTPERLASRMGATFVARDDGPTAA